MRDALLVTWIALLGATRLDFLAGAGPLVLTPFLVLSPIVLLAEGFRVAERGWELPTPRGAGGFVLWASAILALLLVSIFFSIEPGASARRFGLLFVQVAFVVAIGYALAARPDPARLLVRGAYIGLGLCFTLNLAQLLVWFRPEVWPGALPQVLGGILDLEPGNYFGVIPRLAGLSHDPNLGGLLILVYLGVLALLAAPSRLRQAFFVVGGLAVLLTLSRSAVIAGLVLWGLTRLRGSDLRLTLGWTGTFAALLALVTLVSLLAPTLWEAGEGLAAMLGHRMAPDEGSASERALLFWRGIEVATRNVKHLLVGVGYGAGYVLVQDVFPGNVYGNFHSLFVTWFAEAGAPALLVLLGFFAHLLVRAGPYRPLVAALIAFNLFQQAHTEPHLWLILLLAWSGIALEHSSWSSSSEVSSPEVSSGAERSSSETPTSSVG